MQDAASKQKIKAEAVCMYVFEECAMNQMVGLPRRDRWS